MRAATLTASPITANSSRAPPHRADHPALLVPPLPATRRPMAGPCLGPISSPGLLRLRPLLARPRAGRPRERAPAVMVGGLLHRAEDGPLDRRGDQQLRPVDLPVLGVRRLLVVEQAPDLVEDLPRHEARDQAATDADGDEEDLGHAGSIPGGADRTQMLRGAEVRATPNGAPDRPAPTMSVPG